MEAPTQSDASCRKKARGGTVQKVGPFDAELARSIAANDGQQAGETTKVPSRAERSRQTNDKTETTYLATKSSLSCADHGEYGAKAPSVCQDLQGLPRDGEWWLCGATMHGAIKCRIVMGEPCPQVIIDAIIVEAGNSSL